MDRVLNTTQYARQVLVPGGTVPADSLRVEHLYDREGNVTTTYRKFTVDGVYRTVSSIWTFDDLSRLSTYTSPAGQLESYTYDKAGNQISAFTARGNLISMEYDKVNRLTKRVVPQVSYGGVSCATFYTIGCTFSFPRFDGSSVCIDADTSRFSYDAEGNMLTANNSYARVKRSYYRNGALATDSLRIRTYRAPYATGCNGTVASDAPSPNAEFNHHVYGLRYRYNHAGQRIALRQPEGLDTCAGLCDSTRYAYNTRGLLSSVVDWKGNTTTFTYDDAGRLTDVSLPGGWLDERDYDDNSNVKWRKVSKTAVGATVDDDLAYDAMGRLLRADLAYQAGSPSVRTVNMWYSALGSVVASDGNSASGSTEEFRIDALGNRTWRKQNNMRAFGHPDQDGIRNFTFDASRRVTSITAPVHPQYLFQQTFDYDASGNASLTWSRETDYYAAGTLWDASYQYGADQKLRVLDRTIGLGSVSDDSRPGQRGVFEEHRYDALGRRVLTRVRRGSTCPVNDADCASYVQRTVWDGDHVLWEIRAKGADNLNAWYFEDDNTAGSAADGYAYGRVAYVHAGGMDQPIGVIRSNMTGLADGTLLVPHANWRGLYEGGNVTSGAQQSSCEGATNCPIVDWPGAVVSIDGARPDPQSARSWMGSLIAQGSDGSGLQYRRNRYYNPETGQFTQEDPIGLAGGTNLYGFANGDPVNFSDPLGLCPSCIGAATGMATGFLIAKLTGADYGLKEAAVDAALGAVGGGILSKLDRLNDLRKVAGAADDIADVARSGRNVVEEVIERAAPGRDGGRSRHIIEKVNGKVNSVTHQVERKGEMIHQHTTHVGKHGTHRRFPDHWTGKKTIDK